VFGGDSAAVEGLTVDVKKTPSHNRLLVLDLLPQNNHKIVILSGARHRSIRWHSADRAESKDPASASLARAVRPFSTTEAGEQDHPERHALDGHGYIFSCTVTIFHPPGLCKILNSGLFSARGMDRGGSARCGLRWLKSSEQHGGNRHPRGPSSSARRPSRADVSY
jgi:hypothetical protein